MAEVSTRPLDDFGYVYLVGGGGYYKLGRTKALKRRIKWFELKLPFEVRLIEAIWGPHHTDAEKLLHERYAGRRVNGEWFALTERELADFHAVAARMRTWMHEEHLEPLR